MIKTDKHAHLKKYSKVNQAMQTASICSRSGLFCGSLSASRTFKVGSVLRDIPMVETTTNIIEMYETMFAVSEDSGCSIRSQIHF